MFFFLAAPCTPVAEVQGIRPPKNALGLPYILQVVTGSGIQRAEHQTRNTARLDAVEPFSWQGGLRYAKRLPSCRETHPRRGTRGWLRLHSGSHSLLQSHLLLKLLMQLRALQDSHGTPNPDRLQHTRANGPCGQQGARAMEMALAPIEGARAISGHGMSWHFKYGAEHPSWQKAPQGPWSQFVEHSSKAQADLQGDLQGLLVRLICRVLESREQEAMPPTEVRSLWNCMLR